MRVIIAVAGAALTLTSAVACSGGSDTPKSPPTYDLPARAARPDEQAVKIKPVADGDTEFQLIGLSPALPEIVGSHADVRPRGKFVRIRLVAVNNGRTTTTLTLNRQQLVTSDGVAHKTDYDAMIIKRVPDKVELGWSMRLEFDLWYDVPKEAKLTAVRLYGGSTLMDMKDEKSTDLKLP